YGQVYQHDLWSTVHRIDVTHGGCSYLVSQMVQWHVAQIKIYAFHEAFSCQQPIVFVTVTAQHAGIVARAINNRFLFYNIMCHYLIDKRFTAQRLNGSK